MNKELLAEKIEKASFARESVKTVSWLFLRDLAAEHGISLKDAERIALKNGVCPDRYLKNLGTLGLDGQKRLFSSRAAVIGCGGLGGLIVELMARAGVGELLLVDGDRFSADNMNRQVLCKEMDIGRPKAEVAAERVKDVNGAVEATALCDYLTQDNAFSVISGCDVAVDALDSNSARSLLKQACEKAGIPMVHGAIGGFWGQACVLESADTAPWEFSEKNVDHGVETQTGNPPFTASFIASLQASEAIRFLAGIDAPMKSLFWCDLDAHQFQMIPINPPEKGA
ncbi:MAG: HesA/MoeB/ThiF family protein [Synergistota bacterium]|nr:HesA/MoeB/ThiF family protein [Synergistota bacterium]